MPHVVHITENAPGPEMIAALGLIAPARVLLLHGGASDMSADNLMAVRSLLEDGVVQSIAHEHVVVLDGGTQAGIFRIMGESYARAKATFPLIGVCPEAEVIWPGRPNGAGPHLLEPNHTHFVLTPGVRWGDETPFLFTLTDALAADAPSLALLINGGVIAKQEMLANVAHGREVVVVRGSGRLADQIADVWKGYLKPSDDALVEIVRHGKIIVIELDDGPEKLAELLRQKLQIGF